MLSPKLYDKDFILKEKMTYPEGLPRSTFAPAVYIPSHFRNYLLGKSILLFKTLG